MMNKTAKSPHINKSKTNWVKFPRINPTMLSMVGKDTLCISGGCHILLVSLLTKEEVIISANDDKWGDGVSCVTGHRTLNILAYAEKKQCPRIFLVSYPDLGLIQEIRGEDADLLQLSFSEGELLLGLSGFPGCFLNIWKWRTGEHLARISSKLVYLHQILRSGYTVIPLYTAQIVLGTRYIQMWEICACGKKCITRQEMISTRSEGWYTEWTDCLWTSDGAFFTIDRFGSVYKLASDNKLDLVITHGDDGHKTACMTWYRAGLLVQGADRLIKHYEKINVWVNDWNIDQKVNIEAMRTVPGRDRLVIVTDVNELMVYNWDENRFEHLRSDESNIAYFDIINPLGIYMITLGQKMNLCLWDATTGKLLHTIKLEEKASGVHSNPQYPYFAVFYLTGLLQLYSCLGPEMLLMTSFQLTRTPINRLKFFENSSYLVTANVNLGQFFVIKGLPGGKFRIVYHVTHNEKICDFIAVGSKTCFRLFFIPVTSVKFQAGNQIVRYCLIKDHPPIKKIYDVENPERLYSSLYVSLNYVHRDRFMYATPLDAKNLHELEVKRGDTHARIVNRIKSNHMMRLFRFRFHKEDIVSYGYDGLVIWRNRNFEIVYVFMPHHRNDGGINRLEVQGIDRRLITSGRDGVMVCSTLAGYKRSEKALKALEETFQSYCGMFQTKSIGFSPKGKYEGKSFLEYQEMLLVETERMTYESARQQIIDDLQLIKRKTVALLTKNLEGPENEILDIQEFNLNLAHKEERMKWSREQYENLKNYYDRLISEQDRVSHFIMEHFWFKIDVPTRNLCSIFGNFDVQSYCELPPDGKQMELLNQIEEFRKMENILTEQDSFRPWIPYKEEQIHEIHAREPAMASTSNVPAIEDDEEDEDTKRKEAEFETFVAYFGSTIPLYLKPNSAHYEQLSLRTFYQKNIQCTVSLVEQSRLREYFNKEFENVVQIKIKEMTSIIERNARLRYIISELNYFSEQQLDIRPIDPVWKQDERPETLTKVEDSEVSVLPYISPSEQALLDAKAAEEERIRLALLADDFKERALIKMMNGVLELKWEDELRKEVPLPKCMVEKQPEEFNEEDLRQIKDYNAKCNFLKSERQRYRVMLDYEYRKLGNQLREGVRKFNERLEDLMVTKMKIESAIQNEYLRTNRLLIRGIRRLQLDEQEKSAMEAIVINENITEDVQSFMSTLHKAHSELKNVLDSLLSKEKQVEKGFKKEFQDYSQAQLEILTKLYKKRPKSYIRAITSPTVLIELSKALFSGVILPILTPEAVDFLKCLDTMDKYIGISPIVDEALYANLCRHRRMKIEHELKVKACQHELSEAENILTLYQHFIAKFKDRTVELTGELGTIRDRKVFETLNMEVQLVLQQAYVELPRTGSFEDFSNAILVNRQEVESINDIIIKAGAVKLSAMRNAMQFKKEIILKEWEHKRKKMQIFDLEHVLVDIESVRLTKEIQQYLKSRARGDADKQISFEHEVEMMKERYAKLIEERKNSIMELNWRVRDLKVENARINDEILKVNVDVNEAQYEVDEKLSERERQLEKMRISSHLKRSKLVSIIQANHQEILVLQAELELCRLRTVPVLDYKVDV